MSPVPVSGPAEVGADGSVAPPQVLVLGLAVLGLLATIVGRTIAPALPGSAAGIDGWIHAAEVVGAILSVNLLLGACVLLVWLSLAAILSRELPVAFRAAVLPAVAVIVVLSVAAYRVVLYPSWLLWLSIVSAGLAMLAVPRSLVVPLTRGPGLLLALGGTSSLLEVGARVTAIRAGELALAPMFEVARGIATVAFGLDVLALALVLVWMGGKRVRLGFLVMSSAFVLSSLVAWGALQGIRFGASPWMVVAARSLGEMMRHPTPFVQPFVRLAVEVMMLFVAAVVLVAPGKQRSLAGAVSLTLLAGGATDIPLCAMMLGVAALTVPLASLRAGGALATGASTPMAPADELPPPAAPEVASVAPQEPAPARQDSGEPAA